MNTGAFLPTIANAVKIRLEQRKIDVPLAVMQQMAYAATPPLNALAALQNPNGAIQIIAEIKRASPSKGALRPDLDPAETASSYAEAGAAMISVLTEEDFFQGSLQDLRAVKHAAPQTPILRKDFIFDEYQVYEARAAGADCCLLIAALLNDRMLSELLALSRTLGMEPLVEVHSEEEAQRALCAGAAIVGVNSRNLSTFEVDTTLLSRIQPTLKPAKVIVAESGITSGADLARMRRYGASAVLIGEAFMRSEQPGRALVDFARLPKFCQVAPAGQVPFVKICGVTNSADAIAAAQCGADAIGMIFAPGPRHIDAQTARAITQKLPQNQMTIGVFAFESFSELCAIAEIAGLQAVQLTGPATENLWQFADFHLPVLAAVHTEDEIIAALNIGCMPLLDSAEKHELGGTGRVGDWRTAQELAQRYPLMLAGGLRAGNVREAAAIVHPWGVDVSSGVEHAPGKKDHAAIQAFIANARGNSL